MLSTFVYSINVFDCHLSGVIVRFTNQSLSLIHKPLTSPPILETSADAFKL